MAFAFEKLLVYQKSVDFTDQFFHSGTNRKFVEEPEE